MRVILDTMLCLSKFRSIPSHPRHPRRYHIKPFRHIRANPNHNIFELCMATDPKTLSLCAPPCSPECCCCGVSIQDVNERLDIVARFEHSIFQLYSDFNKDRLKIEQNRRNVYAMVDERIARNLSHRLGKFHIDRAAVETNIFAEMERVKQRIDQRNAEAKESASKRVKSTDTQ